MCQHTAIFLDLVFLFRLMEQVVTLHRGHSLMTAQTPDPSHTLQCVGQSESWCYHTLTCSPFIHLSTGERHVKKCHVPERCGVSEHKPGIITSILPGSQSNDQTNMATHPDAVLVPVLFPGPARVTVEQQVTADPVPAVIPSLRGNRRHLHLLLEVHLEPGLLVGHQGRPASCPCRRAEKHRQSRLVTRRYFPPAEDRWDPAHSRPGRDCNQRIRPGCVHRERGWTDTRWGETFFILKCVQSGFRAYREQNPQPAPCTPQYHQMCCHQSFFVEFTLFIL